MYIFNQKDHSKGRGKIVAIHFFAFCLSGWFIGTIYKILKQKGINYMNSRISIIEQMVF